MCRLAAGSELVQVVLSISFHVESVLFTVGSVVGFIDVKLVLLQVDLKPT